MDKHKIYFIVTGLIFACVAILHLVRLLLGLAIQIGPIIIPTWPSVLGTIFPAALSIWAFTLAMDDEEK